MTAIAIKHNKVSSKPAASDPALVDGPAWNDNHTITGELAAANGGTGQASLTAHGVLVGEGTSPVVAITPGSSGLPLLSAGASADPTWTAVGTGGIADNAATFAKLQDIATDSLIGRDTAGTGDPENITLTSADLAMTGASALALAATAVTPGSYTNTSLTVDSKGRLTAASNGSAVATSIIMPQGRITLQTAVPVMTTTQSAKTTVYYTPYNGQNVPLYNGSTFSMVDTGGELSQATTDNTKSPAAVANNSNYDIFVWDDGGTKRATRGPAWSSDTTRGTGAGTTELVMVGGILLNANSITNGPASQRGTYVGTVRSNGSAQIDFIIGGAANGGTAGLIGVWNTYNRVMVSAVVQDTTTSWNVTSTTFQALNAGGTGSGLNNRCSFVNGLSEDVANATLAAVADSPGAANYTIVGIGLDSTSAKAANATTGTIGMNAGTNTVEGTLTSTFSGWPGLGFHFLQALQRINSAGTGVLYGSSVNFETLFVNLKY